MLSQKWSGFSLWDIRVCKHGDINDSRVEYCQKQDQMQKMFTDEVVPIANRLPFFQTNTDGMDDLKRVSF